MAAEFEGEGSDESRISGKEIFQVLMSDRQMLDDFDTAIAMRKPGYVEGGVTPALEVLDLVNTHFDFRDLTEDDFFQDQLIGWQEFVFLPMRLASR